MSKRPKKRKIKGAGRVSGRSASTTGSTDHLHPVFCFRHLNKDYHGSNCNIGAQTAFLRLLEQLSKLEWKRIKKERRTGLGFEKINTMNKELPSSIPPDTTILSFRCSNKARMIGYRKDERFHILFVDDRFDVYDH